jgi:cation diffusion facilitator family transporter
MLVCKGETRSIKTLSDEERKRTGSRVVHWGLGVNTLLAVLKTGIGILGHSPALLADGINSTSDVAYGIVVSVFMRLAGKKPDLEHPYGHDQMESIAAVVIGAFVITTAIAIFWDAVNAVYDLRAGRGDFKGAAIAALWMALFTIGIKLCMSFWTFRVGRQTQNTAVLALAYDHRNDVLSALAAAIGIFFGRMGFPWVDPLAGAMVSLIILHTGIRILRDSTADLMDTVPGQALNQEICHWLRSVSGVEQIEEVYAHRFGPYLVVNITIGVDGSLSVTEGDKIATRVEQTLIERIEFLRRVHVHYHPVMLREKISDEEPLTGGA